MKVRVFKVLKTSYNILFYLFYFLYLFLFLVRYGHLIFRPSTLKKYKWVYYVCANVRNRQKEVWQTP